RPPPGEVVAHPPQSPPPAIESPPPPGTGWPSRSELLRDPRRRAVEVPGAKDADADEQGERGQQVDPAAGRIDGPRRPRIDHPLARLLEQRCERVEQDQIPVLAPHPPGQLRAPNS